MSTFKMRYDSEVFEDFPFERMSDDLRDRLQSIRTALGSYCKHGCISHGRARVGRYIVRYSTPVLGGWFHALTIHVKRRWWLPARRLHMDRLSTDTITAIINEVYAPITSDYSEWQQLTTRRRTALEQCYETIAQLGLEERR